MGSRDDEATLLARCVAVARGVETTVRDQKEAMVFRVAGMVIESRFPHESGALMQAGDAYFAQHPDDRLDAAEIVRRGWVIGLPRLRDRLTRLLRERVR